MDSAYVAFLVYNYAVLVGVLIICAALVPAIVWAVAARRRLPARRPRRFVSWCAAALVVVAIGLGVSAKPARDYYPPIRAMGVEFAN